jgi:hypothetical protein
MTRRRLLAVTSAVGALSLVLGLLVGVLIGRDDGESGLPATSTSALPPSTTATTAPPATTVPGTATTSPPTSQPPATGLDSFPNAANTGPEDDVRLAEAEEDGYWELDHDIENVEFTGTIVPTRGDITIRNVRIIVDNDVAGIFNRKDMPNVVVENVEIVCDNGDDPAGAAVVNVAVLRRSDLSGCADGVKVGSNAIVEGNFIHDLYFGPETHNDGIQMQGGSDVVIEGNTIIQVDNGERQANAAVFIQDASSEIRRVTVRNNYVDGFGFTLRLSGGDIYDSAIVGNVIGTSHLWGPVLLDKGAQEAAKGNVATGNMRPDGSPIATD